MPAHGGRRERHRRLTVRIGYDSDADVLTAVRFGDVIDGQLPEEVDEPAPDFYVYRRGASGPVIGFELEGVDDFVPPDDDDPLIPGVLFDAPTLGLRNASAEAVIMAAEVTLDGHSTPDVVLFDLAVAAGSEGDDEEAETYWRLCLAAGDPRGHFGLGYTLCDMGRPQEAYGHLLEYTRAVPRNAWAWTWLGQAAEGLGEVREAERWYRRALRLQRRGGLQTDADERLANLKRRPRARRRR